MKRTITAVALVSLAMLALTGFALAGNGANGNVAPAKGFVHGVVISVDGTEYYLKGPPVSELGGIKGRCWTRDGARDVPGHCWVQAGHDQLVGKHYNVGTALGPMPFDSWSSDAPAGEFLYTVHGIVDSWSPEKAELYASRGYVHYHELVPVSGDGEVCDPVVWLKHTARTSFTLDGGPAAGSPHSVTPGVDYGFLPNYMEPPCDLPLGEIHGTVFEDTDHDGVRDAGEQGLPGVTLTSTEAMTSPTTTDAQGGYTFLYDTSGSVTITATNLQHYVSTTPDVIHTNVATGSSWLVDFGDFLGIGVTGKVFSDTNVNGVDDNEPGMEGAIVSADGESFLTGSSGIYSLYVTLSTGDPITITETDPVGLRSTDAVPGEFMSRIDANRLRIDSPVSGTFYMGADFGDVWASDVITVSGYVWDDTGADCFVGGDGIRDGNEPYLGGAIISLSTGMTQTTGSDGLFTLYATPGQTIVVTRTNPSGYVSTNAIPGNDAQKVDNDTLIVALLPPGSTSAGNLFGAALIPGQATITGTVFHDTNVNGRLDDGEGGLAGITVTMEISGTSPITATTSATGHYQFAVCPGTLVRITSSTPVGFFPTTLESVFVRPSTSGVFPNNNFGYSQPQVTLIHGPLFDDLSANATQDTYRSSHRFAFGGAFRKLG